MRPFRKRQSRTARRVARIIRAGYDAAVTNGVSARRRQGGASCPCALGSPSRGAGADRPWRAAHVRKAIGLERCFRGVRGALSEVSVSSFRRRVTH